MPHGGISRAVAKLLRPFHRSRHADDADKSAVKSAPGSRRSMASTSSSTSTCSSTSSGRRSSGLSNHTQSASFTLKTGGDGVPHSVMIPPAFMRQLRAIVEQTTALTGVTPADAGPSRNTEFASTRATTMRRGDLSTKALDRMTMLLTEGDVDNFALGRRSARAVPLESAAKAILQLWECCMQILAVMAEDVAPEHVRHTMTHSRESVHQATVEKRRYLEQAALTLVSVVVRRQEIDALLVAVARGGCKAHKPAPEDRRRGIASRLSRSRALSRNSRRRRSISANSANRATLANTGVQVSSKKDKKGKAQERVRLCDAVRTFLELHERTLQFAYEAVYGADNSNSSNSVSSSRSSSAASYDPYSPHQDLLSALISTGFARVPRLRNHMLDNLTNLQPPNASASASRSYSLSSFTMTERGPARSVCEDHLRLTPYNWHHSMYPQCQNCLAVFNREERWTSSMLLLDQLMADTDGCTLVLAQILEQLAGQQVLGRTDWKYVPGFDVLMASSLTITKKIFEHELRDREPHWQDGGDDKKEQQLFRGSMTLGDGALEEANSPRAFFMVQLTAMMHENVGFIHDYLMTILKSTNYMLPHHVGLCLQYLEQLVLEFPQFFVNEPAAQSFLSLSSMATTNPHSQPQLERTCADVETLRYVFSCLLDSEHFEILKATELFLLKHFSHFSVTLQLQLTDLFATHFKRLFLHWNRDVRYCYYHVLLYLTYPGNRLVLGAKSDETLMGAEASQLFEIPGLVRSASGANWDVFDVPLQQVVARFTHVTKRKKRSVLPPSWVDNVPWCMLQRAVTEYKTHVQTYFAVARQLSPHQRVPTPIFSVKSGENTDAPTAAPPAMRMASAVLA